MRTIFRGKIARGKLEMSEDFYAQIQRLEGSEIDLTLEKHKSTRSMSQNKYYWSVIVKMISDETGYSTDEAHEIIKAKFLEDRAKIGNEWIAFSRSTAGLKTSEFEELMTEIREWASVTLNLMIPLPNEVL
jgi:hypothetical protein